MTARRLAPISVAAILALTLAHADARQAQRDPPRTAPPATTPTRDAAKPATSGTAIVRGVVTSEESVPRPVRRAMVSLTATGVTQRVTFTDDEGRFEFTELPANRFRLSAWKAGWIRGYYGARRGRGTGTTIALADGQRLTADLTMMPGAVIAGRIVDQFGKPQAGVRPVVMELRTVGGERQLRTEPSAVALRSSTDDLGGYRIYGLPPGTYVVSATPPPATTLNAARVATGDEIQWARRQATTGAGSPMPPPPGPTVGMAPVFYPGTSEASAATPIVLEAGAERTGIDFTMNLVPMAKVDGSVTRSDGQPASGVQLTIASRDLVSSNLYEYDTNTSRAVVSPQGRFSIASVRPGQYRITARAATRPAAPPQPPAPGARPGAQSEAPDLYAIADVTVRGQDIDNVILVLQPGTTITGRIVFDGTQPLPPEPRTQFALAPPVTGSQGPGRANDTIRALAQPGGTFSMPGIMPGRYVLSATVTVGGAVPVWTVKSITTGGRDITDEVLELRPNEQLSDVVVTFTDRSAEIAGTIFDAAGRPSPGMYVVVFPADRSAWGVVSRRFRPPSLPSTDGKYQVAGLPPGEYYIAALTDLDDANVVDQQSFLEQLAAAAIKVTLKEGEKKVQDLKIR